MPATITPPGCLPLEPFPHPEWSEYSGAYDIVLNAERHAKERLAINPSGREEEDNLLFARVTGFLLIELFNVRAILSVEPCASLAFEIMLPPVAGGTTHDLVFGLGRCHHDYLRRTCASDSSPSTLVSFSRRSDHICQGVLRQCRERDRPVHGGLYQRLRSRQNQSTYLLPTTPFLLFLTLG